VCSCRCCSQSQLTSAPRPGSQHRFIPGLGYDFHSSSPPVVSPPIVSFHAAPRAFPARRGTARAFPEQRCIVRAPRSARVPCAALCCPARRGTAQRGERAGQHRKRARATPRVHAPLLLNQHPAKALLPTKCTAPARYAAVSVLLLLCCHQRLPNAHCSPRAGLNCLLCPAHPLPAASAASPRPARASGWCASPARLRNAPPAPPASALRSIVCDRRSSSQPLTTTARRCSSPASPPRLAAPARRPCPPYCACRLYIFCKLLRQVAWSSPSSSNIKPLPRI
jgi:hypothetical protein